MCAIYNGFITRIAVKVESQIPERPDRPPPSGPGGPRPPWPWPKPLLLSVR